MATRCGRSGTGGHDRGLRWPAEENTARSCRNGRLPRTQLSSGGISLLCNRSWNAPVRKISAVHRCRFRGLYHGNHHDGSTGSDGWFIVQPANRAGCYRSGSSGVSVRTTTQCESSWLECSNQFNLSVNDRNDCLPRHPAWFSGG